GSFGASVASPASGSEGVSETCGSGFGVEVGTAAGVGLGFGPGVGGGAGGGVEVSAGRSSAGCSVWTSCGEEQAASASEGSPHSSRAGSSSEEEDSSSVASGTTGEIGPSKTWISIQSWKSSRGSKMVVVSQAWRSAEDMESQPNP